MNRPDRRKKKVAIGLEALESRKVPSAAPINLDLVGTVEGTPSSVVGSPDVGTTVDFRGSGNIFGMGQAKVTGSLNGTGFFASSRVEGTLTLATSKGNVALHVEGPTVPRYTSPGPGTYTYTLSKGTGAFKHDTGTGRVVLALGPRSFTMIIQGNPPVD
jgi:hypothetical protein